MKKIAKKILILLMLILAAIAGHLIYLNNLAPEENYPQDTYLLQENNKKALIIMAHDDDAVGSAGTVSMLCENGWSIREMCFFQQGGLYARKDSIKNPQRKAALQKVAHIQGLAGVDPVDFNFRNDMNTEAAYMPMSYNMFAVNYKTDSLTKIIGKYIDEHKPAVIFTLDDKIGGYGNPDHVVMSQLVLNYCRQHKNDPEFTVKKIYQAVFPPSLAENVLGKMPVYNEAKKVYQCSGMPLPTVKINISSYAQQKKACMQTYTTEQNSIKKIWPYYNWYPSWVYFRIFDRDFFRVLDVSTL